MHIHEVDVDIVGTVRLRVAAESYDEAVRIALRTDPNRGQLVKAQHEDKDDGK